LRTEYLNNTNPASFAPCKTCPDGAFCTNSGVTQAKLRAEDDWFLSQLDPLQLVKCPFKVIAP
jgi:hypothetical protein